MKKCDSPYNLFQVTEGSKERLYTALLNEDYVISFRLLLIRTSQLIDRLHVESQPNQQTAMMNGKVRDEFGNVNSSVFVA